MDFDGLNWVLFHALRSLDWLLPRLLPSASLSLSFSLFALSLSPFVTSARATYPRFPRVFHRDFPRCTAIDPFSSSSSLGSLSFSGNTDRLLLLFLPLSSRRWSLRQKSNRWQALPRDGFMGFYFFNLHSLCHRWNALNPCLSDSKWKCARWGNLLRWKIGSSEAPLFLIVSSNDRVVIGMYRTSVFLTEWTYHRGEVEVCENFYSIKNFCSENNILSVVDVSLSTEIVYLQLVEYRSISSLVFQHPCDEHCYRRFPPRKRELCNIKQKIVDLDRVDPEGRFC